MKLTKKQYNIVKQGIGPTDPEHSQRHFTRLTGAMLRDLINKGGIVLRDPSEAWDWDSDLFKCGRDEDAVKFLETHPRFFVQGWLDKNSIVIDTVWGAKEVHSDGGGSYNVTCLLPKLKKQEAYDFANTFYRADEFQVCDGFAHAWFD